MKKILATLLFLYLIFFNYSFADTQLSWNKKYQGDIEILGVNLSLPEGQWLLIATDGYFIKGIEYKEANFVREEENVLKDIVELAVFKTGGQFTYWIDLFASKTFFKNRHDGCYEKTEYYLLKAWVHKPSFNCFIVRHIDPWKELYNPDNHLPAEGIVLPLDRSWVRKWVEDYQIEIPKVMLSDWHWFYAKSTGITISSIMHSINPELHGAKKTKFKGEMESEYHKFNIDKYPEAKKFMETFIKQSANRHIKFEESVKAKRKHKLDLSEWNISGNKQNKKKTKKHSNLAEDLKELKKLYDEGILTEEEFTKAKKKLLN